jgi:hypothetical protein
VESATVSNLDADSAVDESNDESWFSPVEVAAQTNVYIMESAATLARRGRDGRTPVCGSVLRCDFHRHWQAGPRFAGLEQQHFRITLLGAVAQEDLP